MTKDGRLTSTRGQAPTYALLLFGGSVSVDAVRGTLTVGERDREGFIRLKAWARIGALVNQLRYVPSIFATVEHEHLRAALDDYWTHVYCYVWKIHRRCKPAQMTLS